MAKPSLIAASIAAAIACSISGTTQAAFIDTSNSVIDTTTGLEWLRLTSTAGLSYNQVIAQLGSNPAFSGYAYASGAQVVTLMSNLGFSTTTTAGPIGSAPPGYIAANNAYVAHLGNTFATYAPAHFGATGITGEAGGASFLQRYMFSLVTPTTYQLVSDNNPVYIVNRDQGLSYQGSFLARVAPVPEPAEWLMMLTGLTAIVAIGKRRHAAKGWPG